MSVNQVQGIPAQSLNDAYAQIVNARTDLTPDQRERLIRNLARANQAAMRSTTQTVALRYFSRLDGSVALDEQNWAITLASADRASVGYGSGSGISGGGHAMIVCEGVKDGIQFLKYAHITTEPVRNEPTRPIRPGDARQEVLLRDDPMLSNERSNTHYGPTWPRPRNIVERMLNPIERAAAENWHVRFGQYREVAPAAAGLALAATYGWYLWNPWAALLSLLFFAPTAERFVTASYTGYHSCRSWAEANLVQAGIRIQLSRIVFTPNELVEHLRSHPQEARLY